MLLLPNYEDWRNKGITGRAENGHLCLQTPFLLYLVCCLCHLDVYTTQHKHGQQCQRQSGQDLEWVGRKLTVSLAALSDPLFSKEFSVFLDFPAGPQVKNLPGNVGDIGLILGPGKFHAPQGSWAHMPKLLRPTCLEKPPQKKKNSQTFWSVDHFNSTGKVPHSPSTSCILLKNCIWIITFNIQN